MIFIGSVCLITTFFLWLAYFKAKHTRLLNLSIKFTPLLILIALAILISSLTFIKDKDDALDICDNNAHSIEGEVETVEFCESYFGGYTININKIDGKKCSIKAMVTDECSALNKNDKFTAIASFFPLKESSIGFDESKYYLTDGILISGEISEYKEIQAGKEDIFDFFNRANKYLDGLLRDKLDNDAYPIASALLLGNRHNLSTKVSRDFARLGIVHILSLSGMHVSLIVTMVGYAISKTYLSRLTQATLILFCVTLFVGISGFGAPAIRAGCMQFLFYIIFLFWDSADSITSLFLSITIICICNPYFIFSLSLFLSFFAMLGCICSARLVYKSKILARVRSRLLRFVILTAISTTGVTFITLPLTYIHFGTISLASIPANIILVPILNIIIYLVPFIMLLYPIHFISNVLAYFCQVLCKLTLNLCDYFADIKNISFSIKGTLQVVSIILIFIFSLSLIVLSKKHIKRSLILLGVGVIILTAGIISTYIDRNRNIYITAFSSNSNDTICIENNNKLTVIDISSYSKALLMPYSMSAHLGYTEVESYVALYYNHKLAPYLDKMTDSVIVRQVLLPYPENDTDKAYLDECVTILDNKGIDYSIFNDNPLSNEVMLNLDNGLYISRSTKEICLLSISVGELNYNYIGASAFEVVSSLPNKYAYEADVLVFGGYGPPYKQSFCYDVPYLDYAIFLGNSEHFARDELLEALDKRYTTKVPFTVRIKK